MFNFRVSEGVFEDHEHLGKLGLPLGAGASMQPALKLLGLEIGAFTSEDIEILYTMSSPQSLERVRGYENQSDRLRSLAGRVLLRFGLEEYFGLPDVEEGTGEYGRPSLPTEPTLDFNIAHSGDWALCLIGSNRRVGVDVELVGEVADEVLARFSESERAYVNSRSRRDRIQAFYRTWTAKEAYMKAVGNTFLVPLDEFAVVYEHGGPILSFPGREREPVWTLSTGLLDDRHPYTACFSGSPAAPRPIILTLQEILAGP